MKTAEQAIKEITSIKDTVFGFEVQKYNYGIQIRRRLQKMAENNEISPKEYLRALKITRPMMSDTEKRVEREELEAA